MEKSNYRGLKVEFHILQSFPVTCLNRDDVGSPKTAVVGGVTRARVSSQSWKRQIRLSMKDFGINIATRTKHIAQKIEKECLLLGATEEQAKVCSEIISNALSKDTLHFFSDTESKALALLAKDKEYTLTEKDKDIIKTHKKAFNPGLDGLDIALFGRMVAQAAELNVEAAASFSHAISTHKVSNEVEFFTALDDYPISEELETGSSHMGSLEFNSATYYRYIGLDLGQLVDTLGDDEELEKALTAFIKALYVAVPGARQTTQAGYNPWDYARVNIRRGQGIQASFDKPVRSSGKGYLEPSIEALNDYLDKKEKLSGSLFNKINGFAWGQDDNFSIDHLIKRIVEAVKGSYE
ncbi:MULTISPECIES: type I-E CRISPR-associated protein Cas7/Cse4/CasC [unclassified Oceanispirochaeta]|uniref:type I-E CRISPR-associated protein Cas7/Cse4/CasC n=1 Tax=unclassified Oceanispirochaeta TaxID=2635722 RepID=UPI000E09A502|nr:MULTISPECIES: type I-E CRISPR-associated protein Cas7/Cse4/CasC [unclassified Oceanispirochaeta]MBF9014138.1 type I-E CRISPR-associated protein Cas7/Cse4/CasC [Oceanispirochaeta sp. M2]NPD70628.1 type I-E CRISPR-associated protein Cas7/Cse4/CasC [Oceanispirochaeta sp. M1]RDG34393.1 type I-E CRISPR-associated protein Cas7/Cse4/CasC [Oceanispirochaeta sp. M1]